MYEIGQRVMYQQLYPRVFKTSTVRKVTKTRVILDNGSVCTLRGYPWGDPHSRYQLRPLDMDAVSLEKIIEQHQGEIVDAEMREQASIGKDVAKIGQ